MTESLFRVCYHHQSRNSPQLIRFPTPSRWTGTQPHRTASYRLRRKLETDMSTSPLQMSLETFPLSQWAVMKCTISRVLNSFLSAQWRTTKNSSVWLLFADVFRRIFCFFSFIGFSSTEISYYKESSYEVGNGLTIQRRLSWILSLQDLLSSLFPCDGGPAPLQPSGAHSVLHLQQAPPGLCWVVTSKPNWYLSSPSTLTF